jgi:hypothetical protein
VKCVDSKKIFLNFFQKECIRSSGLLKVNIVNKFDEKKIKKSLILCQDFHRVHN